MEELSPALSEQVRCQLSPLSPQRVQGKGYLLSWLGRRRGRRAERRFNEAPQGDAAHNKFQMSTFSRALKTQNLLAKHFRMRRSLLWQSRYYHEQ